MKATHQRTDIVLDSQTIDLFKVIVLDSAAIPKQKATKPELSEIAHGYVTNFVPTLQQKVALRKAFKPLDITTLFSVAERKTADPRALIMKQMLHYIEIYGLDKPGLFDLEVTKGKIVVVGNIRGITADALGELVRTLIYANAPIRKLDDVVKLIRFHKIPYDLNLVKNNEARIRLFRDGDTFASGDDAVRYIVFKTTADSLLIKSPDVLAKVKANEKAIPLSFLIAHETTLAQVFNRHKRIIMSLKNRRTNTVINRISRLSKTAHVPIREALNKTFIARALNTAFDYEDALEVIGLRDKLKYLNLLEWRKQGHSEDVFIVRNGRAHLEKDRKVYNVVDLDVIQRAVLLSAKADLKHLKRKSILLDANVDYGLPSSQKQMIGNLPFGTEISVGDGTIASGIYWEDRWGARDLDLSSIDESGNRTGWGQFSGYDGRHGVTFSGDITSAPDGAMEFLTSPTTFDRTYGLFVNIYSGEEGAECELVIGSQWTSKTGETRHGHSVKWIKDPVVREKVKLASRGTILGFVRNGKFVTYAPRVSNGRVSGNKITERLIAKGLAPVWTVSKLLTETGIKFDTEAVEGKKYAHDLSYGSFSIDKLEKMLFNP